MEKNLNVGDCLKTEYGEFYIYLGHFVGKPRSLYNVPSEGYLYMFYGRQANYVNDILIMDALSARIRYGFGGFFAIQNNRKSS